MVCSSRVACVTVWVVLLVSFVGLPFVIDRLNILEVIFWAVVITPCCTKVNKRGLELSYLIIGPNDGALALELV